MSTTDQPKPSTVKKLFAVSGNRCAFPKCNNKLVEMEIVNQLVLNINVETQYQNNGQLANTIINYLVPDIPIKSKKVSCRILLNNIQNNVKDLRARQEAPKGIIMKSLYIQPTWRELYEDISDYLNVDNSATLLITLYKRRAVNHGFRQTNHTKQCSTIDI
ncbi:hypothetical protein [Metabacillus fastidiosus]|uniref:hypothetical protein n=1 Tax=Metabacillus fastidiosus TaxID=1458 RepID=UPI002DB67FF6|nr:hypothetical protein [Metabacillus fastidiosus]MEC2076310.1 hypothetical protein [Metabacillus fastidiosus]